LTTAIKWTTEFGKPKSMVSNPEENVTLQVEARVRRRGENGAVGRMLLGTTVRHEIRFNGKAAVTKARDYTESVYRSWCTAGRPQEETSEREDSISQR